MPLYQYVSCQCKSTLFSYSAKLIIKFTILSLQHRPAGLHEMLGRTPVIMLQDSVTQNLD